MTLRLWTFRCDACGHLYDSEPITAAKVPRTIRCRQQGCEGRASWAKMRPNHIHNSISTLYGRGPDPQYSRAVRDEQGRAVRRPVTVQSYDHKRRLQRELGIEETEVERYEDIMAEQDPVPTPRDPNIGYVDANSDEEAREKILEQLYSDPRVDRKNTGTPRMRFVDEGLPLKEAEE